MNGGVDVGEVPFVGGDLTVWMEIPFSGENIELFLCEFRIDHGEGDTVEGSIPSGEERIFPFIRLESESEKECIPLKERRRHTYDPILDYEFSFDQEVVEVPFHHPQSNVYK